ncbi:uncharacterized protein N7469_007519 [Penicillium citrinum]|uniref:Uncharacterized protein n=2 Tax=Penicillium TaxID=5073 RepID=A0A9W9NYU1_PENCI|nr:uncharacterized protein N7469_007519 [Penicillium citrinum]KAJ5227513.1 hypothetical protein N7469_007519 [Penicillium citrinum]KAJ5568010.1 hypothetical protein N7450_010496 [Penicillium hetheringtonii]
MDSTVKDYNETLRKISKSLENSLETFGPSSIQYHAILEILQDCLRDIEEAKRRSSQPNVDPDVLSLAMGFLKIAE